MIKKYLFLTCFILTFVCSCSNKNEPEISKEYNKIPNSILIIYTSGFPSKTITDVKPEEVDSYSGATPADMNVKIIAQKLCNELRNKQFTVKLARASEIESYEEILRYDMLILGTPTYFWNMHWEMKKMLDIYFEKIYIAKRDEFKKMKHITFAMCEYGGAGQEANQQMKAAINDCSGKVDSSMVFIVKQTMTQYDEQIAELATISDNIINTH